MLARRGLGLAGGIYGGAGAHLRRHVARHAGDGVHLAARVADRRIAHVEEVLLQHAVAVAVQHHPALAREQRLATLVHLVHQRGKALLLDLGEGLADGAAQQRAPAARAFGVQRTHHGVHVPGALHHRHGHGRLLQHVAEARFAGAERGVGLVERGGLGLQLGGGFFQAGVGVFELGLLLGQGAVGVLQRGARVFELLVGPPQLLVGDLQLLGHRLRLFHLPLQLLGGGLGGVAGLAQLGLGGPALGHVVHGADHPHGPAGGAGALEQHHPRRADPQGRCAGVRQAVLHLVASVAGGVGGGCERGLHRGRVGGMHARGEDLHPPQRHVARKAEQLAHAGVEGGGVALHLPGPGAQPGGFHGQSVARLALPERVLQPARGHLPAHVEQGDGDAGRHPALVGDGAVAQGDVDVVGRKVRPAAVEAVELLLQVHRFAGQHAAVDGLVERPRLGPALARRDPQPPRVLHPQEGDVGVVVDLHQLGPPQQDAGEAPRPG